MLYEYKATVTQIYDGDTWTVDIDLGFGIWLKGQKLRLYGINTPEVRGESKKEGKEVRDWCRETCPPGTEILLQTKKDKKGKYGRWLAIIWYNGKNINQHLVDTGRAKTYLV